MSITRVKGNISEECSGKEYSERWERKGKISFDPRFFR